jgi:ADP-ribose pyrophosphatase
MAFHEFAPDRDGWATHRRESLYLNPFLEIHRVSVSSPTRPEPFEWTVCHRKAGVVIAPQTPEGGFVLIRQERVPIRRTIWEFPAGQIDHATGHDWDAIVATGLRELSEEAGYELAPGGEVVPMFHYVSSPGFTDEYCHQIWVRGAVSSGHGLKLDQNECVTEVRVFSPIELRAMVADGLICDANTLSCLARLSALTGMWDCFSLCRSF